MDRNIIAACVLAVAALSLSFLSGSYTLSLLYFAFLVPVFLLLRLDGRILLCFSALSLVALGLLLESGLAESAADAAYFFLAAGALVLLGETIAGRKTEK